MNSKRTYFVMLGLIGILAICLVGGVYGATIMLHKQSDRLVNLKIKTEALNQQQVALKKAKKDIATYAGLDQIAKAIVPQDKDQAEAVREIVNIAAKNGIKLGTISFQASTLGQAAITSSAASGAASPAVAPTAPSPSTKSLSQLKPVPNIPGVYDLQINVQQDTNSPVPYAKFISFLTDLENNRRTAQVNAITLQPDSNDRNLLSFTLTLDEYIKPGK